MEHCDWHQSSIRFRRRALPAAHLQVRFWVDTLECPSALECTITKCHGDTVDILRVPVLANGCMPTYKRYRIIGSWSATSICHDAVDGVPRSSIVSACVDISCPSRINSTVQLQHAEVPLPSSQKMRKLELARLEVSYQSLQILFSVSKKDGQSKCDIQSFTLPYRKPLPWES